MDIVSDGFVGRDVVWPGSEVGYVGYGGSGESILSFVSAAVYSFCQMDSILKYQRDPNGNLMRQDE